MALMEDLVKVCDGVYWNGGLEGDREIHISETKFVRFMDFFYLRCPPDELTHIEVSALCRKRLENPEIISPANNKVRDIFRNLIYALEPKTVLEVGAGNRPILSEGDPKAIGIKYTKADADPGFNNEFSGNKSKLEFPDNYFDLAAAVFVLHFHFYEEQISELSRCLSIDGVFVANVYCRTQQSREKLKQSFEDKGLKVLTRNDFLELCRHHEFWIVGKDDQRLQVVSSVLDGILENEKTG